MPIKSFRGQLADGEQSLIRLSTNDGLTGYRIVKFQGIGAEPGTVSMDSTLKIYKNFQETVDNNVNFEDQMLLAVCYITDNAQRQLDVNSAVLFDRETFNQDIYVTHEDTLASEPCNYYIELEQVKLGNDEAAVATLKDMRGSN